MNYDRRGPFRRRRFLNVETGECIGTDLPELDEHRFLTLTPEGLLLLLHEPTLTVRLLNPLTRQLADLPPVSNLLETERKRWTATVTGVWFGHCCRRCCLVVVSLFLLARGTCRGQDRRRALGHGRH